MAIVYCILKVVTEQVFKCYKLTFVYLISASDDTHISSQYFKPIISHRVHLPIQCH